MKLQNKHAKRDYFLYSKIEAGISLLGTEAKALRMGRGDISAAFARIRDGEAFLMGANIPAHTTSSTKDYDPKRTRKLLLHRHEIVALGTKMKQQNLNLIPVLLYTRGSRVKVELALAKSKKQFDKRRDKKLRDMKRQVEIESRGKW